MTPTRTKDQPERTSAQATDNAARPRRPREGQDQARSGQPAPVSSPATDWQRFLGNRTPTPVQAGAIPALLAGRDVITTARTGSGKTLAFLIPAAARGIGMSTPRGMRPEVLVVTPTRELAVQIRDVARELGMPAGRITGGITPNQTRSEASGKGVIAGTPGRLKDLITRGELSLAGLRYVVLDEADELLSLGFLKDVGDILRAAQSAAGRNLQIAMASATFPAAIREVAERFMHAPERIDIAPERSAEAAQSDDILGGATGATHLLVHTTREAVLEVAAEHAREALRAPGGCVVIFCRTKALVKRRAERLAVLLPGEEVSALQGNMDQKKRERTMDLLREGQSRVLVATDIAGRGIDLPEVRLVIHMDVASTAEDHVHRSGRTARAGRPGVNLVLLIPEQRELWRNVRRGLPAAVQPPLTREEGQIDKAIQEKQGQGRGGGGGRPGNPGSPQPGPGRPPRDTGTASHSRAQQGQKRAAKPHPHNAQGLDTGTGAGRVGPQKARGRRR
ncbi:ATP-dependent RNA helicase [Deinococcus aerius]|uniref:RNA helicase n=1 Tax=Deinococcus aerius TaxID=200253 RepID=A0A2I9DUC7_9DEIO|nr:DEAD/DEAH box helicase [Deinococcus aerius]GBF06317.1 ATP-dependent RNA helicase [Deinococcus aerius]